MNTDPSTQDEPVPPEAASNAGDTANSGDTADASSSASLEQSYNEAIIRLAVIAEEWQQARDALLGG